MTTRTVTAAELEAFYNALPTGSQNALTARELSRRLSLGRNGDRMLRAFAEQATEQGMLVCTTNSGYFKAATMSEALESIGRIASQGQRMTRRARAMQAIADRQFGQQQTFGI